MTSVLWHHPDNTLDRCTIDAVGTGYRLAGTYLGAHDGLPVEVRYVVMADPDWRTRDVGVHVLGGPPGARLALAADGSGSWSIDGSPLSELEGCLDADLGFSPATKTLAIRRLGLAPGESADTRAVYIGFPGDDVEAVAQRYQRVDQDTYRYSSAAGEWVLKVDDESLVTHFEGEWRALAVG